MSIVFMSLNDRSSHCIVLGGLVNSVVSVSQNPSQLAIILLFNLMAGDLDLASSTDESWDAVSSSSKSS